MSKNKKLKSVVANLSDMHKAVIGNIKPGYLLPIEHFYSDEMGVFDQAGYEKYLDSSVIVAEMQADADKKTADFHNPQYPLSVVLDATGVKKATLRNWLTRKQIELDADESHNTDKWRLFSARDVMQIAVLHSLSNSALSIADAGEIAKPIMRLVEGMATRSTGFAGPPTLEFWKFEGEWHSGMSFETQKGELAIGQIPAVTISVHVEKIMDHVFKVLSNSEIR